MTKKILPKSLMRVSLVSALYASSLVANIENLTLQNAVEISLKNSTMIQTSALDYEISKFAIVKNLGIFDPTLELASSYSKDASYTNTLSSKNNSASLSKLFEYGTSASASISKQSNIYESASSQNNYTNSVLIRLEQPLLKGYGKKITTYLIEQAKLDSAQQKQKLSKSQLDQIYKVESSYWQLVRAVETEHIHKVSYELSKDLVGKKSLESKIGGFAQGNLIEIEADALDKESTLIRSKKSLDIAKISLLNEMLLDADKSKISVNYDFSQFFEDLPIEQALDMALKNSTALKQIETDLQKQKLEIANYKNSYLPKLNMYAQGGKKDQPTSNSGLILGSDPKNYAEVGVSFSMPLFFSVARSDYETSRLTLMKKEHEKTELVASIKKDIASAIEELKASKTLLEQSKKRYEKYKAMLNIQDQKLQFGLSSITEYLVNQQKYITAELDLKSANIDYILTIAKMRNILEIEPSWLHRKH